MEQCLKGAKKHSNDVANKKGSSASLPLCVFAFKVPKYSFLLVFPCCYNGYMINQSDTILNDALKLPLTVRAYVAERLIESLDEEKGLPLSPAWQEEIERRRLEVENGTVALIAAEEAFAHAHRTIE